MKTISKEEAQRIYEEISLNFKKSNRRKEVIL